MANDKREHMRKEKKKKTCAVAALSAAPVSRPEPGLPVRKTERKYR